MSKRANYSKSGGERMNAQKELEQLLLDHLRELQKNAVCENNDFSQTAFALIELWKTTSFTP